MSTVNVDGIGYTFVLSIAGEAMSLEGTVLAWHMACLRQ
jgi:hypothetical protein